MNDAKEEELLKQQAVEKRQWPKRMRSEMKTRELMFRESLRISYSLAESHEDERDKIRRVCNFIFNFCYLWLFSHETVVMLPF